MPYLTDLAEACRKSGLNVVETSRWKTRGHGSMTDVQAIVCHHTATAKTAPGNYPSMGIVRDGRSDLSGPLAQLGLGRDGTVYVIAAGLSYHAGVVHESWQGNAHAIGIEAEHDGISPWPAAQRNAYPLLCAALALHYGVPVARVLGHKEVASPTGRKTDPNFDMASFRHDVTAEVQRMTAPSPSATKATVRAGLRKIIKATPGGALKKRLQRFSQRLKK